MRRGFLCLVLCLLLSSCGSEPVQEKEGPQPPLLGGAAGVEEDAALLIVDGQEVPAWRYLYWLARACDAVWAQYEAAGTEVDWTADAGGRTLAEYTADQALTDTLLYATVENWAARYGCGGGTGDHTQLLPRPELGLDGVRAAELDRVGQMYAQLYVLFCTEDSALFPSEETLAAFADAQGWTGCGSIRIPFAEDRDAARERAEVLFSRLNGADDAVKEFAALVEETGGASGFRTFQLGMQETDAAVEDALNNLEEGQYSGIVETEDGFAILLRCAPETEPMLEPCFDYMLQIAAAEAEVRSAAAYGTLDVSAFYQRLREGRIRLEMTGSVAGGDVT